MKKFLPSFLQHPSWAGIAGLFTIISSIVALITFFEMPTARYGEQTSAANSRGAKDEAVSNAPNNVADIDAEEMLPEDVSRNSDVILKNGHRFAVFEEQVFQLCGYKDVTATSIETKDGKKSIKIRSMDRRIPNRPFRGYEKIVPEGEVIELWPNCNAKFKFENLQNSTRIIISTIRDKK